MTTKTRRLPVIGAVTALLLGALVVRSGDFGGDIPGSTGTGGCVKQVTYSANWGGDTRAFRVEWGPVGSQRRAENVTKPWQKLNVSVRCGTIVALHVEFRQPVRNLLCAITANNAVHQPHLPGKVYRCFEQVLVY